MTFSATRTLVDLVVVRSNHIAVRVGPRCFIVPSFRGEIMEGHAVELLSDEGVPDEAARPAFVRWLDLHSARCWAEQDILYEDACSHYYEVTSKYHFAG